MTRDRRTEVKVEGAQSSIRGEKLLHFPQNWITEMVERTFLKIVEGKVNVIRKRILIYELSYTLSFIYILLTVAK